MLGTILSVALLVVEFLLKKNKNDTEVLEKFYQFIHESNANQTNPLKINRRLKNQAAKIMKELQSNPKVVNPVGN